MDDETLRRERQAAQRARIIIGRCSWTRSFALRLSSRRAHARRARGFTLIEILVVIVILGVLAALIVPDVLERPDEARVTVAKSDIAAIMQALKLYRLDNQRYPTAEQGTRRARGEAGAYRRCRPTGSPAATSRSLPNDPWGRPYVVPQSRACAARST